MEIQVPAYYVVSPDADPSVIRSLLLSTPPSCAIIVNPLHFTLAASLADDILRVSTSGEALDLAQQLSADTQRPVVVIGLSHSMDAVYADGHRETLC